MHNQYYILIAYKKFKSTTMNYPFRTIAGEKDINK